MNTQPAAEKQVLNDQRRQVLEQLEDWLETPMLVLGFVWLALLLVEFIWGLSPFLETVGVVIWVVFILDFALKFFLAPDKSDYLKGNWLTALALFVPALRAVLQKPVFGYNPPSMLSRQLCRGLNCEA